MNEKVHYAGGDLNEVEKTGNLCPVCGWTGDRFLSVIVRTESQVEVLCKNCNYTGMLHPEDIRRPRN